MIGLSQRLDSAGSSLRISQIAALVCFSCFFSACSQPVQTIAAGLPCEAATFIVEDKFDGARRGKCEVFKDGHVRLTIVPEDEGYINDSPWYAFKLVPKQAGPAKVILQYVGGTHRYHPKWSVDGDRWHKIDSADIEAHSTGIEFAIDLKQQATLIAAQEIILPGDMEVWRSRVVGDGRAEQSVLGQSIAGENIYRLDINKESKEVIFLVGRQHPPEVTGAIGFMTFYETILADTPLATEFRERFHVMALPMLNPDGVNRGHWRHNLGGADLNRDWGPFEQPETILVNDLLNEMDAAGKTVRASVDFHSTKTNTMYTQEDVDVTNPANFARDWIIASKARLQGVQFSHQPRPTSDQTTSRNYMYERYGIPAVTYEVSDTEDRDVIRLTARVFAEEFMRMFLATPQPW